MSINYPTLSAAADLAHFRHSTRYPLYAKCSTFVENIRQITPFYAKQTQLYAFFARKCQFHEKTNPIQTQFKPNLSQLKPKQTQSKPIQTQFQSRKAKNERS
jgi:hypothetical protein